MIKYIKKFKIFVTFVTNNTVTVAIATIYGVTKV